VISCTVKSIVPPEKNPYSLSDVRYKNTHSIDKVAFLMNDTDIRNAVLHIE
jgi:hypothetical protein